MVNDAKREWLVEFEWSVRALAQTALIQQGLFPEFVCVADELALEFEECLRGVRAAEIPISSEALEAVVALDGLLLSMSGPAHPELWTDAALASLPQWEEVRQCARTVLASLDWPTTSPGPSARVYVGPDPSKH